MKRLFFSIAACLLLLLLPGCWDQDLLKEAKLVYGFAYDITPDGKLVATIAFRETKPGQNPLPRNEVWSSMANTPRQNRDHLDTQIGGNYRSYKQRISLYGEELVKRDLYPLLDVIFRDPKNPVDNKVVVVKGKATEVLRLKQVEETMVAEYLEKLIESMENLTKVPRVTPQTIWPLILDPGQDFALPYLTKTDGGKVKVLGMAMFHERHFTKPMIGSDVTLYLLLKGERGKTTRFTEKVNPKRNPHTEKYISIDVKNAKNKMDVKVQSDHQIDVDLNLQLNVAIVEYAPDRLFSNRERAKLEKKLSKALTKQAHKVVKQMQEAGFDGFGVGRQLIAHHPDVWKKVNWSTDYRKVRFHPSVQVQIIGNGIIE
ncbi:Ger(x)C family spore germination protein [Desmospora activa]|uniref:Ger(X)C family germination protein n=1 Tax=Desmospora activa DSM 45169 TaxID=1121389 RepID=A0A2T4Z3W5_9BACL|nr:Ger(x)C family spore germination protein [Desmospora activa]PTM56583.1 Ger(x)C family germination protein [Desmospora activa DSM 45169]